MRALAPLNSNNTSSAGGPGTTLRKTSSRDGKLGTSSVTCGTPAQRSGPTPGLSPSCSSLFLFFVSGTTLPPSFFHGEALPPSLFLCASAISARSCLGPPLPLLFFFFLSPPPSLSFFLLSRRELPFNRGA